jgi:hypothetical protein
MDAPITLNYLFTIISLPVDQNLPNLDSFAACTQCIFHTLTTALKKTDMWMLKNYD